MMKKKKIEYVYTIPYYLGDPDCGFTDDFTITSSTRLVKRERKRRLVESINGMIVRGVGIIAGSGNQVRIEWEDEEVTKYIDGEEQ